MEEEGNMGVWDDSESRGVERKMKYEKAFELNRIKKKKKVE